MKKLVLRIVKLFNEKWGAAGFILGAVVGVYVYFTKVQPSPLPTALEGVLLLVVLPAVFTLALGFICFLALGFIFAKDMFN